VRHAEEDYNSAIQIITMLLDAGASNNAIDYKGRRPIDYLRDY
jgi:hypothetical protein